MDGNIFSFCSLLIESLKNEPYVNKFIKIWNSMKLIHRPGSTYDETNYTLPNTSWKLK